MKLPTAAHHRFVGHDTASSPPFGCGGTAADWTTHEAAAALGTNTTSSATAATTSHLEAAALINIRSPVDGPLEHNPDAHAAGEPQTKDAESRDASRRDARVGR